MARVHSARYKGSLLGLHGATVARSLHPRKNLGAFGYSEVVTITDAPQVDRMRVLRDYGSHVKYVGGVQAGRQRMRSMGGLRSCPLAEQMVDQVLSLPMGPLANVAVIGRVSKTISEFFCSVTGVER